MIAIPVAAFMGSLAMIVGPAPQTWCNHFGLSRPMIAIPTADDCGSLHVGGSLVLNRRRSLRTRFCVSWVRCLGLAWIVTRTRTILRTGRAWRAARPVATGHRGWRADLSVRRLPYSSIVILGGADVEVDQDQPARSRCVVRVDNTARPGGQDHAPRNRGGYSAIEKTGSLQAAEREWLVISHGTNTTSPAARPCENRNT